VKHISTIGSSILLGSVGITVMSVLSGCEAPKEEPQNKFLVIEQQAGGKYVVLEEMPTEGPSRAIIREKDAQGNTTERFMNEEEMKQLAQQEYEKMQSGNSELNAAPSGDGGMGLAGTILAVAAGSLLGNMIGNALMNNKNFQQHSNRVNKSAYSRSAAGKSTSQSSGKKSFFGGSKSGTSKSSGGSFGG
jgi:uncharacterized membrane protein YgcG